MKLSSDMLALVDIDNIMYDASEHEPPKHVLMLCGNKHSGKTVISQWFDDFGFTHFYPLPIFPKQRDPREP